MFQSASLRFLPAAGPAALLVISLVSQGGSGVPVLQAAEPESGAPAVVSAEAAESAAIKLQQIQQPSSAAGAPALVRFTEQEVNSYLHYELASQYPPGLSRVNLQFTPSTITGTAEVDFDKAKAARPRRDPAVLDYLFWGVHTLAVEGGFSALNGAGHFELASVWLDGVPVPRPLVDFLMETYLKPRFPALAIDSPFLLPYSIDRVQVGRGTIEVEVRPSGRP